MAAAEPAPEAEADAYGYYGRGYGYRGYGYGGYRRGYFYGWTSAQTNKQTNPLNYNTQDQVTRNSFNLATMQIFPPPLFFLKHENSLFFPIELES